VVQRVKSAGVQVNGAYTGRIGSGYLVFLGVEQGDTDQDLAYLADKILHLRIFEDDGGRLNRSILDIGGSVLLEALRPGGVEPVAHRGPRPAPAGRPVRWAWRGVGNGGDPVAPGLYVVRATLGDASGNRTVRERTCWVGRMAGTITPPDPLPRTILGVSLRDTRGAPVPGDTPITLQFRRRTGVPGRTATPPLGDPVGAPVATTAASARITTPAGIRPDALWLVASSGDGSAIALIAPGAAP
jgi:hypothetical protein